MTDFFGADIPFAHHCGIVALEGTPDKTRLGLKLGEPHQNHMGTAHGGIILTLLDIALGSVARLASGHSVMTINLQSSFLSPGRGELVAEGRVLQQGRSLIFCEGEVRDAQGVLVAKATGLFKTVQEAVPNPDAPKG
ncbi:PaaI family thioesterase [Methyloferula stellata]|uniref:PaaI family thioesterase n=1 Tax=Methyloferula stellata TaxID=876270 RepID=UPI00036AC61E|nr:PaaI family thioesterase [Methyloferula stellata]